MVSAYDRPLILAYVGGVFVENAGFSWANIRLSRH